MEFKNLQGIEEAARKKRADSMWASVDGCIGSHSVTVSVDRAMINRGLATGTCDRWTYKLNGKRVSRANLVEALERKA